MSEPDPTATLTSPPTVDRTRTAGEPPTVTADPPKDLSTVVTTITSESGAVCAPPGFVLERELGEGGMGVVYLARQLGLNRPVALKLVKDARVDAKAIIRFLAEAEAVAAVRHPNVVEVYQYGDHAGKPYMALEFCPGGDLTALSKAEQTRNASWFRRVAELMTKVADGVNAAHALGIVHRDLKPHNVFLTADGTPKVADFGLAKRGLGSDLTHTGAVMGTPAYMAPEQAGGGTKFVGPEADVWALGVMLYELCCGQRPIDTSGPLFDAIARVANPSIPSLSTRLPSVPPDLSLIAHKCLSPDPRDRYPTADALATDLRNWLEEKPIAARRAGVAEQAVKWARRNRKLASMGLAVFVTMAAAIVVSLGFALEANAQKRHAAQKASDLSVAFEEKTKAESNAKQKADDLADQLKESERRLDLTRLREAETDFERNTLQSGREKLAAIAPENRCIAWGLLNRRIQGGDISLFGHTGEVYSVAFSPDGRRLVTGSDDKTARVWDVATGQAVLDLKGHAGGVNSVAFSPDGTRIATGGGEVRRPAEVRVWDATTGQSLLELKGHADKVISVAFSPDGKRIVTGSDDKTARVWDATTGQSLLEVKGHTHPLTSVAFSPDGRRLVTGSDDKTARVWDVATGQAVLDLKGHAGGVNSVAFSPDGTRIATGGGTFPQPGEVWVWDAATGRSVLELKGHTRAVHSVAFSPDGRRIATGASSLGSRCEVWVWDAATGRSVLELKGHTRAVHSVAFSPDGRRIATGSLDKTSRVWDAAAGQSVLNLKGHADWVTSVAFSPDGRRIATGAARSQQPGEVWVWDAATGQSLFELKGHAGGIYSVAFSPDGKRIVTGGGEWLEPGEVRVWDAATGRSLLKLEGHTDYVTSVAFNPNGTRIVTGSIDGKGRVWDTDTGRSILELSGHLAGVMSVAFSYDGRRVLTGGGDGMARVWDAASGSNLAVLKGHTNAVCSVGFSPNGRRVVTGSWDNTARVWDAVSGQSLFDLRGHTDLVRSVGFSPDPDGRRVVTGSADRTARVWDAVTGQSLLELKGYTHDVSSKVYTADLGGHLPPGMSAYGSGVTSVAVSPDGTRIVTGSGDSGALVWETDFGEPDPKHAPITEELDRRRWVGRSRPDLHAKLAEQYRADPFACAVQRSLEQRSRGLLAVETGDFDKAWGYFLAAEVLRPKPTAVEPTPQPPKDK